MWGGGPFHGPLSLSLPLSLPLRLYLNWLAQRLENPMVNLCAVQTGFTSNILLTPLGGVVRTRSLSRCRRPPARSDTFLAVSGRYASAQENCLRLAHPKDHPVPGPVQTSPPRGSRSFVLIRIEDRVIARFVMCFCSGVSLPFADSSWLITLRKRCLLV